MKTLNQLAVALKKSLNDVAVQLSGNRSTQFFCKDDRHVLGGVALLSEFEREQVKTGISKISVSLRMGHYDSGVFIEGNLQNISFDLSDILIESPVFYLSASSRILYYAENLSLVLFNETICEITDTPKYFLSRCLYSRGLPIKLSREEKAKDIKTVLDGRGYSQPFHDSKKFKHLARVMTGLAKIESEKYDAALIADSEISEVRDHLKSR